MDIYIVKENDTVDLIAMQYGISTDSIIYNNQLPYPYRLAIGQALLLSTGMYTGNKPDILTNGYAYPYISDYVLEESLPYLTNLSVFSYGFTADGILIEPSLDDEPMITMALQHQTNPILTLTPINSAGYFDNSLITSLVNDQETQQILIDQLIQTITDKNYRGVSLDFEYILREDRNAYVEFVQSVRSAVNALGYPVSVALAPKTSDTQIGVVYEGVDYKALGEAADTVVLMTYEWGYTFGPPMAVAPLDKVRDVVEYALTVIPPEKIYLGVPNYGYDWPLPFVRGVTRAQTVGNIEAVQLAITYGAEIQFDDTAMSPYFNYTESQIEHVVWFEDVRSLDAKFNLVKEFHLKGISYWQIMQLFRANWLLLADRFSLQKTLRQSL